MSGVCVYGECVCMCVIVAVRLAALLTLLVQWRCFYYPVSTVASVTFVVSHPL